MRVRWHGHACFEIDGSVKVVVDPHDGKSLGIPPPSVKGDLILISHDHFDHNAARIVQGTDSTVISKAVMTVERGVRIEGIEAAHDQDGGARRGRITIFKFELDGVKFCHLGDLGHSVDDDLAAKIGDVDLLFVPTGDTFTIGPKAAKEVVESIEPKVAIPMHYRVPGLGLSIQPVQNFVKLFDKGKVMNVGNEIDFSLEELPRTGTEVWVFAL